MSRPERRPESTGGVSIAWLTPALVMLLAGAGKPSRDPTLLLLALGSGRADALLLSGPPRGACRQRKRCTIAGEARFCD